jgi:hypothetical protein
VADGIKASLKALFLWRYKTMGPLDGLGNHIDQLGNGEDASAATSFEPKSIGQQQGSDPSHQFESETHGTSENEPYIANLKTIAGDIYGPDGLHDTSLPSKESTSGKESIGENGPKKTAPPSSEAAGKNNSTKVAQTNEKDSAHAARNELFQNRWQRIKKQGESSQIDTDNMHELHGFEQVANNASFETMQNVASLMTFMHSMKNNPVVQKTGTLIDKVSGGKITKNTAEKYLRVIPHIAHATAMSTDPDTKKMTAGAFRLAFTPNLVDGDEEAGEKGLETKEVRLIRDSIRRHLQKSGFNPNTGELVDKDRSKSIADAKEAAAQKQKDFFLNGFDTLPAQKRGVIGSRKDSPRGRNRIPILPT